MVTVKYFTTLRELAGCVEENIEIKSGASLADLIGKIATKYGKEAKYYLYHDREKIDPSIYFLVNGSNTRVQEGTNTKLKDSDVVAIIPPIGGG